MLGGIQHGHMVVLRGPLLIDDTQLLALSLAASVPQRDDPLGAPERRMGRALQGDAQLDPQCVLCAVRAGDRGEGAL